MAYQNPSNQLIQIDSGDVTTFLYNPSAQFPLYRGIGENQVLGQRFFSVVNRTPANPGGAPAIHMLVQYLATSALVDGNIPALPSPVYWADSTFSTVTGISTESPFGINGIAGVLRVTSVSIPGLTAAALKGAQLLITVAGFCPQAAAAAGTVAGDFVIGAAGIFLTARTPAGTPLTNRPIGMALGPVVAGAADLLVSTDII